MSDQKEWLYVLKVTRLEMLTEGANDEEAKIVSEHYAYLHKKEKEGQAILMGRTLNNDQSTVGLVIFRAKTEDMARNFMENDPAVKNKIMSAELFPFRVAIMEGRSG